jgi:hypothetical protein
MSSTLIFSSLSTERARFSILLISLLFLERIYQARCLCEAEERMIHRIENVKAVEVCDVTKEVASTAVGDNNLIPGFLHRLLLG